MQTSGKNNECEQENFSLSEGAFLGQGGPESKHSVSVEGKGLGHVGTCSSPNMSHYPIMLSRLVITFLPRSVRSYDNSIFRFLKNLHSILHSGSTKSHP